MMRAPMTLSVGTLLSATGLRPTGHGPKSSDKPVTIIGIRQNSWSSDSD